VRVLCTPDARVEATYQGCGPVIRACGGARVAQRQAEWSEDPVVVFAGRAQSGRGVDDLIDAFRIVRAKVPRARLRLLLLPGRSATRWRARLATEPWAEVHVGGLHDLDDALAECQVGAFPFRWSNTLTPALAAAEAMAVGLPVVATDVACLAPLVEPGVNGVLIPPCDTDALAHALVDVLQASESWAQLSRGARKTIEGRWSWAAAAGATREAYAIASREGSRT
jgi:glycosyltransferase involved in cell wall biosynthesis